MPQIFLLTFVSSDEVISRETNLKIPNNIGVTKNKNYAMYFKNITFSDDLKIIHTARRFYKDSTDIFCQNIGIPYQEPTAKESEQVYVLDSNSPGTSGFKSLFKCVFPYFSNGNIRYKSTLVLLGMVYPCEKSLEEIKNSPFLMGNKKRMNIDIRMLKNIPGNHNIVEYRL